MATAFLDPGPGRAALYMAVTFAVIMGFVRWRHTRPSKRQRILQVFLDHPDQRLYGLDVAKRAGCRGGTLYPALARLETSGWILSDWGEEIPDKTYQGRPLRRRIYWLNPWRKEQ